MPDATLSNLIDNFLRESLNSTDKTSLRSMLEVPGNVDITDLNNQISSLDTKLQIGENRLLSAIALPTTVTANSSFWNDLAILIGASGPGSGPGTSPGTGPGTSPGTGPGTGTGVGNISTVAVLPQSTVADAGWFSTLRDLLVTAGLVSRGAFAFGPDALWTQVTSAVGGLVGSHLPHTVFFFDITKPGEAVSTGTLKGFMPFIDEGLKGSVLANVSVYTATAGTGGSMVIDVNKGGSSVLSTKATILDGATSSVDSAVVDGNVNSYSDGDIISWDVDSTHTTPAEGVTIALSFEKPT